MVINIKKLIASLTFIIIVFIGTLLVQNYMSSQADEMTQQISKAEQSATDGNKEESEKQLDEFAKKWDSNRKVLCTFVLHSEIDIANQSAAKLKSYLQSDEKSQFFAECETLKFQINHITERERYSVENIF